MRKTNTGLAAYALAQLGRPYWFGTFGQKATESLLVAKTKQYPKHYTNSRMEKYKAQLGHRVFDCIGLIKGYIWSDTAESAPKYVAAQDKSATSMLTVCKEKGAIETMPDIPGILVFYPGHVGVYIGSGYVIEARGFAYGVVKTKLSDRPWKSWGKCPYIEYDEKDGTDMSCKKGDRNTLVYSFKRMLITARLLGVITQKVDDNNIFGDGTFSAVLAVQRLGRIEENGIADSKTVKALGELIDAKIKKLGISGAEVSV